MKKTNLIYIDNYRHTESHYNQTHKISVIKTLNSDDIIYDKKMNTLAVPYNIKKTELDALIDKR
jgi:hypothetical protein